MKIKNLKYIFGFAFCVLFVWYSFAGPDVSSTNSCQSQNYSTNPANNSGNVDNSSRYYNSTEWMTWWYNAHPSSTAIQWNILDIINYKLALLRKFDSAAWYSSPVSVWHLQNALKEVTTCTTVNRDCKLWTDTNSSFFSCNICKGIDSSYEEPTSLTSATSIVCRVWYEKVTEWDWNNLCCKEEEIIENYVAWFPRIDNTNSNRNGNKAHIVITYNEDDPDMVDHREFTSILDIITVVWNWLSIDENSVDISQASNMILSFDVNVTDATDLITVNVDGWLIVFTWNVFSNWWSQSFPRSNSCQYPPATWNDCSRYFNWKSIYDAETDCCIETWSCQNEKNPDWSCTSPLVIDSAGECCITCQHPADGSWNCQEWFTKQWDCCFDDNMCWDSWYNAGWQCIDCTWDTMPNPKHTRCICNPNLKCCWVQLNTVVPFIWDCIEMNTESNRDNTTNVNSVTAFPILMQWLMKILMSVIMIFSFLMIIVAWLMIVSWAFGWNWFTTGKKIIKNVIISLILLWCSWLILSLINPSFFGG